MKKFIFAIILILIFSNISLAKESGKFIVILLDQLSLKEVSQYGGPALLQLFDGSAQALMNVRTDNGIETANTYQAFASGNRGEKYGAVPGMLGELLKVNNYKAAAYGNMDFGTEENREVMTIVMDNNSHFFYGDVSRNTLLKDPNFSGGWRTDYNKLGKLFLEGYDKYDLIVLEIGDLARIKRILQEDSLSVKEEEILMQVTMERFDLLLTTIKNQLNSSKDRLMVLAPTPDDIEIRAGAKLSWVLLSGNEEMGVLTTGTTKRPGLVTISDLAPTILEHFQIVTLPQMIGRPIYATQKIHGGLSRLMNLNQRIVRTSLWRPWYIKAFILIQIVVLFMAILFFFSRKIIPRSGLKIVKILLLGIMFIPMTFLLVSPYFFSDFYAFLIFNVILMVFGTWLMDKFCKNPLTPVVIIIFMTVSLIILDIFGVLHGWLVLLLDIVLLLVQDFMVLVMNIWGF